MLAAWQLIAKNDCIYSVQTKCNNILETTHSGQHTEQKSK